MRFKFNELALQRRYALQVVRTELRQLHHDLHRLFLADLLFALVTACHGLRLAALLLQVVSRLLVVAFRNLLQHFEPAE